MGSLTRARYTKDQWHEVVAGAIITQFTHVLGASRVVFTQAAASTTPESPFSSTVPIIKETNHIGDSVYFSDVPLGESIYFYPIHADVELTIAKDRSATSKNHALSKVFQHTYPTNLDQSLQHIDGVELDYLYGRNLQIDASDPERAVWSFGDDDISPRADLKTFPTVSGNFYIASSNALDTSVEFTCSTIDASGNRVVLTATTDATNGQTPVLFGTGLDINFVFMSGDDQENLGEVYFTNDGNFTAGRPDTPSSVLCHVPIGYGCSPQAILKVPAGKKCVFENVTVGISRDSGAGGSGVLHCNVKQAGRSYVVAEEWHLQTGPPSQFDVRNLVFGPESELYFSLFSVSDTNTNVSVKVLFYYVDV